MRLFSTGFDPGDHGGVGLVSMEIGGRPRLEGLWPLFGRAGLWMMRLEDACQQTHDYTLLGERVVVGGFVEKPVPTMRKGSLSGDRRGHTTWLGLGRRVGKCEMAWHAVFQTEAVVLDTKRWTGLLYPDVKHKKVGDGIHRLVEARRLVEDPEDLLGGVRKTCRIDCAEAVLVSLAGLRLLVREVEKNP